MPKTPVDVVEAFREAMNVPLMQIGGTPVSAWTLVTVAVIIAFTLWVSRVVQDGIRRTLELRHGDQGRIHAIQRLAHYAVLAIGLGIGLQTAGINLSALFAAGAVVAVGIGFALQKLSENFVSGLLLLGEQSIKPGDVLEVEDRVVRVVELRMRNTIARTRDDEELLIPNATLASSTVKNLTLSDSSYRVRARVGVVYSSDPDQVLAALDKAARAVSERSVEHWPVIFFREFGDSALIFEVSVWVTDPWGAPRVLSELNLAILRSLRRSDITVAFPQVDVHLDPPVVEGLRAVRQSGSEP